MTALVIAVDGPAGSGKSSVSRAAAAKLGFAFLDTGAAYRALTWFALERGLIVDGRADTDAVVSLLSQFDYSIGTDANAANAVKVGLTDVTEAIREPRVAAAVSAVARIGAVRDYMVAMYRRVIADSHAPGIVVEGRDITTVVAPHAEVRVLLTASPEVRAARRAGEQGASAESVAAAIAQRDSTDSQNGDFMTPAPGVILLDTTELSFDESVDALVGLATAAHG
ncbi:MAG: (d)CMP kinase [Agromyces sp.]